ncbi:MAG TPA: SAM-dependent methyltransferase [Steroidobacteraceae bacterium]|jgi:SAM-dependent MidA family methyltransferase|nr:SAM-dependent methyltransferase [Steroidobacteraceae bacterium]
MMFEEAQAAQAARAREHLENEIAAGGGWLSFERFMDLALYAPGTGYYSGGAWKLGMGGDFTTAPEVSSLFGRCVALQCAEVLSALPGGSILELGAGSGRLAVDVLARLEELGQLPEHYWILEVSADLRERQRTLLHERLPQVSSRVAWLDRPPEVPFDGIVFANEVLDALPVKRFRWLADGVEELGVGLDDGCIAWAARPANVRMTQACQQLYAASGGWDEGYVSEYCPRLPAWTRAVTQSLRQGAALWFDYGLPRAQYYLPERHDGTLVCHYRHRAGSDPFVNIGLQDITAWVDFTHLAEASREAEFELAGFTTQAHFLAGLGIDREMRLAAGEDQNSFARLANQARQLMLPGEMGERFKAMAWLRGLDLPLSGFGLLDLRHTL